MEWDLWLAAISSRSRRRRPSLRVGVPWLTALLAWMAMARLAVDGRAFNAGWTYWLLVGAFVVPVAVILGSLVVWVRPSMRSSAASTVASLAATVASVLLLRVSREPFTFAVLGGFVVALLATVAYVLAGSTGETARRDAEDW